MKFTLLKRKDTQDSFIAGTYGDIDYMVTAGHGTVYDIAGFQRIYKEIEHENFLLGDYLPEDITAERISELYQHIASGDVFGTTDDYYLALWPSSEIQGILKICPDANKKLALNLQTGAILYQDITVVNKYRVTIKARKCLDT